MNSSASGYSLAASCVLYSSSVASALAVTDHLVDGLEHQAVLLLLARLVGDDCSRSQ
jgi:hypothetical protein